MRYYKSSILSIALVVALNGTAAAQNSTGDFPWRAKAKSAVKSTTAKATATSSAVKSNVRSLQQDVSSRVTAPAVTATAGDFKTVTSNAVTAIQSTPDEFYSEGKKYIRQGETYIESSDLGKVSAAASDIAHRNHTSPTIQTPSKTSLFEKAKGVGSRLNPFSKQRSLAAYESKDWKVPSFSKSLAGISGGDDDPITFAPINPLPAKVAQPTSIDETKPLFASANSYQPKKALSSSQFTSALPTETSITSAVPKLPEMPKLDKLPALGVKTIAAKSAEITKEAKDFSPQNFAAGLSGSATKNIAPIESAAVSVFEKHATTAPQRNAALDVSRQFWTPRR